jgi:hypothetical protein
MFPVKWKLTVRTASEFLNLGRNFDLFVHLSE